MRCVVTAIAFAGVLLLATAAPSAAEIPWENRAAVSLTFGLLTFTEGDYENNGPVLGIEGRYPLAPRWSIGAAVSGASDIGILTDELSIVPIEVNVTRMMPVSTRVVADLGGGLAAVHGTFTEIWSETETTEWVFGGQLCAGVDWIPGRLEVGMKATYQITGDFADFSWSLDNWRIVLRTGVVF